MGPGVNGITDMTGKYGKLFYFAEKKALSTSQVKIFYLFVPVIFLLCLLTQRSNPCKIKISSLLLQISPLFILLSHCLFARERMIKL